MKPKRITSPAPVFATKARDALAVLVVLLAVAWTKKGVALIVRFSVVEPVPVAFVALSVTLEFPGVVGVPEITPVEVLTLRPAGKPIAEKLVGEFVAVI